MVNLEHVAEQIAADVTAQVKQHPQYVAAVQALAEKALQALFAEAGL